MYTNPNRMVRNERGQGLVEFALVVPMLLILVFGIAEFGRAWMTRNVLTRGRAGGRPDRGRTRRGRRFEQRGGDHPGQPAPDLGWDHGSDGHRGR